MRPLRFAVICIATAAGFPQIPEAVQVPNGVVYKTAADSVNVAARAALIAALKDPSHAPMGLFDTAVTCGPTLWKALKPSADKALLGSKLVVAIVDSVQTEARAFVTGDQRRLFWVAVMNRFPELNAATIRKASAEELRYFWATVAFDIEEPFFTAEAGPVRLVMQFRTSNGMPALYWIDQVGDLQELTKYFSAKAVDPTLLTMMADSGDVNAMLQLARAHWRGDGVPLDTEKGRVLFDRAAGKGNIAAQMLLGMAYFSGYNLPKDKTQAAKYLQPAAAQGNSTAQYYVGMMLVHGDGIEKSPAQGARYLQLAADQNLATAQYDLGVLYSTGEGVAIDKARACQLYASAAAQDHIAAMNNLGRCYELGEGVERNIDKALEHYLRAAKKGDQRSVGNLVMLYAACGAWEDAYVWLRVAQAGRSDPIPALEQIKSHLTAVQLRAAEARIEAMRNGAVPAK